MTATGQVHGRAMALEEMEVEGRGTEMEPVLEEAIDTDNLTARVTSIRKVRRISQTKVWLQDPRTTTTMAIIVHLRVAITIIITFAQVVQRMTSLQQGQHRSNPWDTANVTQEIQNSVLPPRKNSANSTIRLFGNTVECQCHTVMVLSTLITLFE